MKKNYLKVLEGRKFLLTLSAFCSLGIAKAQNDFPFDEIPLSGGTFNNTITINTNEGVTPFNNLLLGSNVDFNTNIARLLLSRAPLFDSDGNLINNNAANQGFNSLEGQRFIEENDPVAIRFPQGVFANTYHWERVLDDEGEEIAAADSRHIIDPFIAANGRVISLHNSPVNVRIGYPALRGIFDAAEDLGRPLNLLTVLSIIGNDVDSNGRRWSSMIADGHDVRDMELGNEFFFRSQRSGTINTEAQWRTRAAAIVNEIKSRASQLGRTVRFAIPIAYRPGDPLEPLSRRESDQRFNDLITQDESFFDALVVHRYVNVDRGDNGLEPNQLSDNSLRRLLSASVTMDESLTYCRTQVSESKNSIWLTEWGVAGSREDGIGASFLGSADTYSHIIRNQDRLEVERVNWFSTVGLNSQFTLERVNGQVVATPTGYGDIYRVLRDNLRDSELFNSVTVTSPELTVNGQSNPLQEVNALTVIPVRTESGAPRLVIINKTNRTGRLIVNRDGNTENSINYVSRGVRWESLTTIQSIAVLEEESDTDAILVPPYSLVGVDMSFGVGAPILSTNDNANLDDDNAVVLFPNPTSSILNIVLKGMNNANIVITDLLGKTVFEIETNQTNVQLDTANILNAGVYLVSVTDGNNRRFVNKLVVN
jgi:hypothetical protein